MIARPALAAAALCCCAAAAAEGGETAPLSVHGYLLAGYSARTTGERPPGDGGDLVLGEERLRLELNGGAGGAALHAKAELAHDALARGLVLDLREAYAGYTVGPADVRLGRLIVTWGVGDLFFVNDVFPKDWDSFFSGRPLEYLKPGVDAVQVRLSSSAVNAELLVIPSFTPDVLPSPSRFFVLDPYAGVPGQVDELPESRLGNTELALRLYRHVAGVDVSVYAYRGFWRVPATRVDDPSAPTTATRFYPRLSTYGASAQQSMLAGTLSLEAGLYDSRADREGSDPVIPNSQWRFLAGYQREISSNLTMGVQAYGERMARFRAYRGSLPAGSPRQDELRGLFSIRLTHLLAYETWKLSLFAAYSPTDEDYFVQPEASYRVTDELSVRAGANLFGGRRETTFFGQLDRNDNVYVAGRADF